jgi:hypothetical protein
VNPNFKADFEKSRTIGKQGEHLVKELLTSLPFIEKVTDTSELPGYQFKEIDLLLDYTNGEKRTVEVKTDVYSGTGNLAIETVANEEIGRKGWLYTSEATLLFYLFINGLSDNSDNLLVLDFNHVRNIVANNPHLKQFKAKPEQQLRNTGTKTTKGILVPRRLLKPLKTYRIEPLKVKNSHSAQASWK